MCVLASAVLWVAGRCASPMRRPPRRVGLFVSPTGNSFTCGYGVGELLWSGLLCVVEASRSRRKRPAVAAAPMGPGAATRAFAGWVFSEFVGAPTVHRRNGKRYGCAGHWRARNENPEGTSEMAERSVLIVMGSDSDLRVMQGAASALGELGVPHSVHIASAHRTPEKLARLVAQAEADGCGAIIAGAGGAAHLPGVVAASTTLPVIGVPIAGGALNGMDALYAIVQMPKGIPVATVAIDGAYNAGLLAAQMLALSDPSLAERLKAYRRTLAEQVESKDARLQEHGVAGYLAQPR
jgi:5-(carboxyamino)imidazole ribonucleotide mutase